MVNMDVKYTIERLNGQIVSTSQKELKVPNNGDTHKILYDGEDIYFEVKSTIQGNDTTIMCAEVKS
jgi:hypothetical protein